MKLRAGAKSFSLLFLWGFLGLGVASAATGPRETISLNTGWRFQRQTAPGSGVEWEFRDAWKPDFDDSHWSSVFIPHSWDQSAHSPWVARYHWRGIGWYRKEFTALESAAGHKAFLEFEGAFQATKVWLNGKMVGEHTGGYTGFVIDVTGVLSPGKKNLLAVRMDRTNDPDIPPAAETNIAEYGGLYRDVWVHLTNPTYIPDGGISITTPEVTARQSRGRVVTEVTNSESTPCEVRLVSSVLSKEGQVVAEGEESKRATPGQTAVFDQPNLLVSDAALWHPDHPNLYMLRSRVYQDGRLADEVSTRFGIRVMSYVAGKGYTINGEFINLHGVNRRQDYGYLGDAVLDAISRHDMEIIKELGANLVRTAHYVQDKSVLEAADELGIVVWEEIPNIKIYDYSPAATRNEDTRYTRKYIDNCRVAIGEMIRRDKNHPSIAIWGIGDDLAGYPYIEDLQELHDRIHELDPVRWTAGRVYPFITDVHDPTALADRPPDFDYQPLALPHPDWKWLWNEWGAYVNERGVLIDPVAGKTGRREAGNGEEYAIERDFVPSELVAAIFQEASWIKFEAMPWMATTKWEMFDAGCAACGGTKGIGYFYGFPDERPWGTRFTGGDYRGLFDLWRIPKASYWFLKAQWTDQPFVSIVGHWTWPGTEGKPRTVRIYSTCDEVELFLNGKSLGKRQPATTEELIAEWGKYYQAHLFPREPPNVLADPLEGRTELPPGTQLRHAPFIWRDVPYEPGTLKAVGTKAGQQFVDERVTAGKPYQIILQPDRDRIAAGGRDAVRIVATIADEHGVMVPSANPWLTFRVAGPGDLLGTPVFDAVWGMGAINIQSRSEPGELVVTATSPGLQEGRCRIVSRPSR